MKIINVFLLIVSQHALIVEGGADKMDVFAILGFVFGIMGFIFSINAFTQVSEFKERLEKLETRDTPSKKEQE